MSPEAKQGYHMLWEEVGPAVQLISIVALVFAGFEIPKYALAFGGVAAILAALHGKYLSRTRWSGRPLVLITAEVAKAIQDGKYNLKTHSKEHLH